MSEFGDKLRDSSEGDPCPSHDGGILISSTFDHTRVVMCDRNDMHVRATKKVEEDEATERRKRAVASA